LPPASAFQDAPAESALGHGAPQTARLLEEVAPGAVIENSAGQCYVHTRAYPLHALRGPRPLGEVLSQSPASFAPFHPNFGLHAALDYQQAVFLDTETTGLGAGAGIYCFMVGVGVFEAWDHIAQPASPGEMLSPSWPACLQDNQTTGCHAAASPSGGASHFVVRQFFMRHPGEEGALLLAVADILDRYNMSVTFNGRTFDLPLLRARYAQNRHIYPDLRGSARLLEADRPHLDLLHPARRLWRRRLQSCRLIHLEAQILGLQRSEEDIPGHLIPQLYIEYVRSGDASALGRVFYHNQEDVLSMVGLAERLGWAFCGSSEQRLEELLQREDWLALGACYETSGQPVEAETAYRQAIGMLRDPDAKADAFQRLGNLLKRQRRWAEAMELWQYWLTSVPGLDPTPYIELAKCCEWQLRDLEQAEMWAAWALHNVSTTPAWQRSPGMLADLERRLARIRRKQGKA
jgi:uncharacterized protein YprB with RNaseH-like and TPR domain